MQTGSGFAVRHITSGVEHEGASWLERRMQCRFGPRDDSVDGHLAGRLLPAHRDRRLHTAGGAQLDVGVGVVRCDGGPDTGDGLGEQRQRPPQWMRAQVEQAAAAPCRIEVVAPARRRMQAAHIDPLDPTDVVAMSDRRPHEGRERPVLEVPDPVATLDEPVGVGQGRGERLLDEHPVDVVGGP